MAVQPEPPGIKDVVEDKDEMRDFRQFLGGLVPASDMYEVGTDFFQQIVGGVP
jgi:hypothetical protein